MNYLNYRSTWEVTHIKDASCSSHRDDSLPKQPPKGDPMHKLPTSMQYQKQDGRFLILFLIIEIILVISAQKTIVN